MSVVKITNPNPYDWMGTECYIDGEKVSRVRSVNFHVAVYEMPVVEFKMMTVPDIEMECLAQISVTSQSITVECHLSQKKRLRKRFWTS